MSVTRTVVPGDWYGVLGGSVIVLLPPAAKSRVAGIWEIVDDGAGFDEVLDAVISDGLRGLPGFVLVSGEGRDVKVVIRGAGRAELSTTDGSVTVEGAEDSTWVEQNVNEVTGLRVEVGDAGGPPYTIDTGLVRVAAVEHPAGAGRPGVLDAEAVVVPVSAGPAAPVLEPDEPDEPDEPARPKRILPPDPQLEKAEPPAPERVPEPPTIATPSFAPVAAAPAPGALDAPPDALGGPGASHATASVARLVFSSGEVVDVDRVLVVGRAPDAGRIGGAEQVGIVTVPSPHQEISSTHLEIRPGTAADQGSAVVTDLGSTNGTVVVQPGLPAEDLRPGVGVRLDPGATIDLGEGVTIQVERGRSDAT
jgi:hypothetical protein